YMIGAESAIEPIHMAPSGYLTEQYDSRFALQAPVPEPETYTMLLAGAALLGFKLRRKPLQS
ncbi:MAG TPA: PEP-CTERM sorting domain-containing protein, partial [Methylophilaceae bacterium]|nr:PEP-CTERM sorting domain-containing protein [Methylophilaceae bacterium]